MRQVGKLGLTTNIWEAGLRLLNRVYPVTGVAIASIAVVYDSILSSCLCRLGMDSFARLARFKVDNDVIVFT